MSISLDKNKRLLRTFPHSGAVWADTPTATRSAQMLDTMKDLILTVFEKMLAQKVERHMQMLYMSSLVCQGRAIGLLSEEFQRTRVCGWLSSLKIALCRRYTLRLQVTLCLFVNTTVLVGRSEGRNSGFSDKLVYNFSALGNIEFDDRTTMYNPVI